jgi:hypothetical protein
MREIAERESLIDATQRAVHEMGGAPPFEVEVEAQEGAFARVLVRSRDGQLTPLFGFARQQGGAWNLLSFGTDFEASFYEEHAIPAPLRLP